MDTLTSTPASRAVTPQGGMGPARTVSGASRHNLALQGTMRQAADQLYQPDGTLFSVIPSVSQGVNSASRLFGPSNSATPITPGPITTTLEPGQAFGGMPPGSDYWSQTGTIVHSSARGQWVDLGNGVRRWEGADGFKHIQGLSMDGTPVTHSMQGQNEWWFVEQNRLNPQIRTSAQEAALASPGKPETFQPRGLNASPMEITQHPPAADGAQWSIIRQASGDTVNIYSQSPLDIHGVQNVAQAVSDAPPSVYPHGRSVYVLDRLGEVRTAGGTSVSNAAGTTFGTDLTATRDMLARSTDTAYTLNHEAGHVLDHTPGGALSETATNASGNRIFGQGRLENGALGEVDLRRSDFVSEYASRNAAEDFAETHRYALEMRQGYNAQNPGADLFNLDGPGFRQELQNRGISPGLTNKMDVVADQYRASAARASQPEAAMHAPVEARTPVPLSPEPPVTDAPAATRLAAADLPEVAPAAEGVSTLGKVAVVAEKAGGALAVVGGGFQTAQGVGELRSGHVTNGVADTGQGALNVAGGAAMLVGGAASTVAAPIALGAGALIDGGRDVINGVREHDTEKVAVGGAKGLAGTLMAAGGVAAATGAGAPVGAALALAGGAIYAGAAVYEHRKAVEHFASNVSNEALKGGERAAHAVENLASGARVAAGTAADQVATTLGGAIHGAQSWVQRWF